MKKVVTVDCDGVLADFNTAALTALNQHFGRQWTQDHITTWDICEALSVDQHVFDDLCTVPEFCLNLVPLPGAVEFCERMREEYDLVCLTSAYEVAPTWTYERIVRVATLEDAADYLERYY